MKDIKIKFDAIYHESKKLDDLMHASDVFENSKRLGKYHQVIITANSDVDLSSLVNNIKEALESTEALVIFVALRSIDSKPCIDNTSYLMEGVSSISNGKQWGLLKDFLESIGYKTTCDDRMRVTSAYL